MTKQPGGRLSRARLPRPRWQMPTGLRLADRPAAFDAWLPRGRSGMRKKAVTRTTERLSGIQMRIAPCLVLAFALVGASPAPRADGDPVSLIAAVYASYEKGGPELSDLLQQSPPEPDRQDEKETPEGMVGRIDWDVFVDGQDWRRTELKIVRATFKNFGRAARHPHQSAPRTAIANRRDPERYNRLDDVEGLVGRARRLPRRAA